MVIREFFQIFSTKTDLRKTLCSTLSSHRMYVQRVYTLYHQKATNVHFVSKIISFETFFSINSYGKTITFHNKLILPPIQTKLKLKEKFFQINSTQVFQSNENSINRQLIYLIF